MKRNNTGRWLPEFRLAAFMMLAMALPAIANEVSWLTDSETGARIWNPAPHPGETIHWASPVQHESAEGPGIATWKINGLETETAAGQWQAGKLHGLGVWRHRNGDRYEGYWQNGRKHGPGIYTFPDGEQFRGIYSEDVRLTGSLYDTTGKPLEAPPSATLRRLAFEAEEAAIKARVRASEAQGF